MIDRSRDVGYHPRPKHLGFPLDLPPIESEIVAVFQPEKPIRGEPVQSCKLRYFNSFEFFDHTGRILEYCFALRLVQPDPQAGHVCTLVHILRTVSYEWDPAKAKANFAKHRVRFADAVTVLEDDLALTMRDPFSEEEERWITLGRDVLGRLLVVIYTWRGESVRLISARMATVRETTQYEEHHEA